MDTEPPDHASQQSEFERFIGGKWVKSDSGEAREAINPATGESLGRVPVGTRSDARRAIEAASDIQSELEAMSAFERAEIVREMGEAIDDSLDLLAEWLTMDQGKPLDEAETELELVVKMYAQAASEIELDETPSLNSTDPDKHMFSLRKPHGVYGVITPWNYPTTIPREYHAPGLGRQRACLGSCSDNICHLDETNGGARRDIAARWCTQSRRR